MPRERLDNTEPCESFWIKNTDSNEWAFSPSSPTIPTITSSRFQLAPSASPVHIISGCVFQLYVIKFDADILKYSIRATF